MFAPLETRTKLTLATSCQAFSADNASVCSEALKLPRLYVIVLEAQWCGRAPWFVQKPLTSQSASVAIEATGALLPLPRAAEPPAASGKVSPESPNMPHAALKDAVARTVVVHGSPETDEVSSDGSPNFLNRLLTGSQVSGGGIRHGEAPSFLG